MQEENKPNINLENTNFDNIRTDDPQNLPENVPTGYNPPPVNDEMNYANFQKENSTDYKKIVLISLLVLFFISSTAFGVYKLFFSKKNDLQEVGSDKDKLGEEDIVGEEDTDEENQDKTTETEALKEDTGTQKQSVPETPTPAVVTPEEEIPAPTIPTPNKNGAVEING